MLFRLQGLIVCIITSSPISDYYTVDLQIKPVTHFNRSPCGTDLGNCIMVLEDYSQGWKGKSRLGLQPNNVSPSVIEQKQYIFYLFAFAEFTNEILCPLLK